MNLPKKINIEDEIFQAREIGKKLIEENVEIFEIIDYKEKIVKEKTIVKIVEYNGSARNFLPGDGTNSKKYIEYYKKMKGWN